MTKKQLQELVAKNLRKHPNPMIDTTTGLEALQEVPIDWIVRNDTARKFYELALQEAVRLPSGVKTGHS